MAQYSTRRFHSHSTHYAVMAAAVVVVAVAAVAALVSERKALIFSDF